MKKLVFSGVIAMSFLAGNAMAEGCLYSKHGKMAVHDQADDVVIEEQVDPELLALLLKKKQEQSEQTLGTVVTYN